MSEPRRRRTGLPPPVSLDPATWRLRVDGLVYTPREVSLEELESLGKVAHRGSFTDVGSDAEGTPFWTGIVMSAFLPFIKPLPRATCFYVHAPGFRALIPLDEAPRVLLATRLHGERLSVTQGGPCRLIVPESSGRLNVKWVERIELFRRRHDQ